MVLNNRTGRRWEQHNWFLIRTVMNDYFIWCTWQGPGRFWVENYRPLCHYVLLHLWANVGFWDL